MTSKEYEGKVLALITETKDDLWGVGTKEENALDCTPANWASRKAQNLAGYCLMKIRDDCLKEKEMWICEKCNLEWVGPVNEDSCCQSCYSKSIVRNFPKKEWPVKFYLQ